MNEVTNVLKILSIEYSYDRVNITVLGGVIGFAESEVPVDLTKDRYQLQETFVPYNTPPNYIKAIYKFIKTGVNNG